VPLVKKSVTSAVYRELLRKHLLPLLDIVGAGAVFQQDNAKIHTSAVMNRFFARNNITVAEHPPYSPDLNPIEHAWTLLKRQVLLDYPDIGDMKGGPDRVKAKLAELLPLCWKTIPEKHFKALWESMPNRVQAVIDAKGWQTKY
jgi:transposase